MFKDILKGKVVIVGIGNIMRGDDGFGPELVKRLNSSISAVCIDAGTSPENYTGKIKKENPDTILIADAVHLDLAPGEYRILKKDDILKCGFTTHDISPNMLIEYLEKETGAGIYMLGIQPKHLSFGDEMSEEVEEAMGDIVKSITEA